MKAFRIILASLFSFLVLVSSTSFLIGMHFCKGEVQTLSFFSKAESCNKQEKLPPCHRPAAKPCCADETIIHEGDDFNATAYDVAAPVISFVEIAQPLVLIAEVIPDTLDLYHEFYNYDPPLWSIDLTVEHQVFLI